MITFILLVIALIACAIFAVVAIAAGGFAVVIVYGDVIVCILLIIWLVKKIIGKNKR